MALSNPNLSRVNHDGIILKAGKLSRAQVSVSYQSPTEIHKVHQ